MIAMIAKRPQLESYDYNMALYMPSRSISMNCLWIFLAFILKIFILSFLGFFK